MSVTEEEFRETFQERFHDVRVNRPKSGQVMARYAALAEFVDGIGKRDIIMLLKTEKATQAANVMKKIHGAREPDCYRVCRQICEDLLVMSDEEVELKPYPYVLERFYYAKREHVPADPHWEVVELLKWDDEQKTFRSTIRI